MIKVSPCLFRPARLLKHVLWNRNQSAHEGCCVTQIKHSGMFCLCAMVLKPLFNSFIRFYFFLCSWKESETSSLESTRWQASRGECVHVRVWLCLSNSRVNVAVNLTGVLVWGCSQFRTQTQGEWRGRLGICCPPVAYLENTLHIHSILHIHQHLTFNGRYHPFKDFMEINTHIIAC